MDIPLGARPRPNRAPWLIGAIIVVLLLGFFYIGARAGGTPTVTLTTDKQAIGRETSVQVVASEPVRGLVTVSVALVQGDNRIQLAEESFDPQPAHWPWGDKTDESTLALYVGKQHQPALNEGAGDDRGTGHRCLDLVVRGPGETVERRELPVRLTPPALAVTAREIYVTQGGAEVVTYTVGPTSVRDGVKVG